MFYSTGLSTANYDALLIGWSGLNLQNGVQFHAGNSTYCNGDSARQSIINNYNWSITDGGLDCTTSIDEESIIEISLYPNPVSDVLNIRGNTTELSIVIYNILGKQVMRSRIFNSLDVSSLNYGIYLVELSNGQKTTRRKLIKK